MILYLVLTFTSTESFIKVVGYEVILLTYSKIGIKYRKGKWIYCIEVEQVWHSFCHTHRLRNAIWDKSNFFFYFLRRLNNLKQWICSETLLFLTNWGENDFTISMLHKKQLFLSVNTHRYLLYLHLFNLTNLIIYCSGFS